jgi:hypothetical protein
MKAIAAALLVLVIAARAAPAVADQAFKDDFALAETVAPGSPVPLRGDWTPEQNAVDGTSTTSRPAATTTTTPAGRPTTSDTAATPTDQMIAPASPADEGGGAYGPAGTGGGGSPAPAAGPKLEGGSS